MGLEKPPVLLQRLLSNRGNEQKPKRDAFAPQTTNYVNNPGIFFSSLSRVRDTFATEFPCEQVSSAKRRNLRIDEERERRKWLYSIAVYILL